MKIKEIRTRVVEWRGKTVNERLMAKDPTYALGEGRRHGLFLSTVASALEVVDQAVAEGKGDEDFSALVEPLRRPAAEES